MNKHCKRVREKLEKLSQKIMLLKRDGRKCCKKFIQNKINNNSMALIPCQKYQEHQNNIITKLERKSYKVRKYTMKSEHTQIEETQEICEGEK